MSKVTVICPIYNTFPEIIGSMINQTHTNWTLLLIHDGPNSTNLQGLVTLINDVRITYIETPERKNEWGHPIRKWALENIDELSPNTDFVVITNPDNHIVPHYLEYLLKGFDSDHIIATYCSQFVHAYESWQKTTIIQNKMKSFPHINWEIYKYGVIDTRLELGYIDCSCVMMRKQYAVESGWPDMSHSSDWGYFWRVINKYGKDKWKLIRGALLVHN